MKQLPLARKSDLIERQLDEETLIYDLTFNKALCLNKTAAIVYKACDGFTTFEDLKAQSGLTGDLIFLTLDGLQRENLIESRENFLESFGTSSRRQIIKKVGLTSMVMLPIVSTLIAPVAGHAASTAGGACLQPGQQSTFSVTGTFGPTATGGINAGTCRNAVNANCCSGLATLTNPPDRCVCPPPSSPGDISTFAGSGYTCN